MKTLVCVFLAAAGIAAASNITGTYNIDAVDGSSTTIAGVSWMPTISRPPLHHLQSLDVHAHRRQVFSFSGVTD